MIADNLSSHVFGIASLRLLGSEIGIALVDEEFILPHRAQSMLQFLQPAYPTLPIMLLTHRLRGYSKTYAWFDIDKLAMIINADVVPWDALPPSWPPKEATLPF